MQPSIEIHIETEMETASWDVGQRLIDSLYQDGDELVPEYVSQFVPKGNEGCFGVEAAKERWAAMYEMRVNGSLYDCYQGFYWRRRRAVKCQGNVKHTSRDCRCRITPGHVWFSSGFGGKVDWYSLFRQWCELFSPKLGILHHFTAPELACRTWPHSSFQMGAFGDREVPGILNAGWAMVYGDEFAEKVDAERIAAAGFPIEKLGNAYLVRVTENILDVKKDFAYFSRRRAELKKLFPEKFFIIEDEPAFP